MYPTSFLLIAALALSPLSACGGSSSGSTTNPQAAPEPTDPEPLLPAPTDPTEEPSCDDPGEATAHTPVPDPASDTSDFNVAPLACEITGVELECELGADHFYLEEIDGSKRAIFANGIPDHDIGVFPNSGNPNEIAEQSYAYEVPVDPEGPGEALARFGVFGIALSGVVFDPSTAELWNGDATWKYEALRYADAPGYQASAGGTDETFHPSALGLDCNFGHVQPGGTYHYHGPPAGMIPDTPDVVIVGWAADGYPILGRWGYSDPLDSSSEVVEMRSSWALRQGERPGGADGPGGAYDGTFTADWEYVEGLGDLDECNGRVGIVSLGATEVETYHYYLTYTYPYVPRCFEATPDTSFARFPLPTG